jgi:hypothetical protein
LLHIADEYSSSLEETEVSREFSTCVGNQRDAVAFDDTEQDYHLCIYQAYDAHMNLILSDVEETITLVDVGDDGAVSGVRVSDLI